MTGRLAHGSSPKITTEPNKGDAIKAERKMETSKINLFVGF